MADSKSSASRRPAQLQCLESRPTERSSSEMGPGTFESLRGLVGRWSALAGVSVRRASATKAPTS